MIGIGNVITSIQPTTRRGTALQYRIAQSRWDHLAAFQLVYESYADRGLIEPNYHRLRVTPFHLLPTTHTFLALERKKVVCCVTLIGDGELGLPMETIYQDEVDRSRSLGLNVGEVSCLAAKHADFRWFLPTFVQLTRLMAQHARLNGMHQFLVAVHPKHARFYERFMGFQQVGPLRQYPNVQDAPAVALCLDFERIDRERPSCWNDFFGMPLPESELMADPMSMEEINYFRPAAERDQSPLLITA